MTTTVVSSSQPSWALDLRSLECDSSSPTCRPQVSPSGEGLPAVGPEAVACTGHLGQSSLPLGPWRPLPRDLGPLLSAGICLLLRAWGSPLGSRA